MEIKVSTAFKNNGYTCREFSINLYCICTFGTMHNCQVTTFGGIEEVLDYFPNKEQLLEIVNKIQELEDTRLFLFDIDAGHLNKFSEITGYTKFVGKMKFENTNGNDRILVLVNIDELIDCLCTTL